MDLTDLRGSKLVCFQQKHATDILGFSKHIKGAEERKIIRVSCCFWSRTAPQGHTHKTKFVLCYLNWFFALRTMSASAPAPASSSGSLKIGIVGFGTFARFLAQAMIKQGHSLRATSRTDYSQLCADLGITFFSDVAAFLGAENDVILICTSILSLSQVLKSMPFNFLKKPALFVDVLSVKEHARDTLLQVLPEDSDILCTHPMFGPESGKDGWRDLNFMYERVRVRDEKTCSSFLKIFETEGCRMLEMSCTKHDELAAKSQFITHTIGRILSEMDIESTPIDTKSFEALVQLRKNMECHSFDLFSGLYIHNRFAKQELKNLEFAFEKLEHKLLKRNDGEQEVKQ